MTGLDVLRFAAVALRGHGLRTGLSMLGVTIGVASVIMLTSLGDGARTYVTEQFMSLGTNILAVVPGKSETSGALPGIGGVPNDLTIDDARELARRARGVRVLAPVAMGNETVSYRQRSRQVAVFGASSEMLQVRNLRVLAGSFLPAGDWDRGTPVVVLGHKLWSEIFGGVNALGQTVRVGDVRMRVIGVMAEQGLSLGVNLDDIAYVPVATAMRLFNRTSLFRILVQLNGNADVDIAKQDISAILSDRHDEEDFTLITQDAVMSAFTSIFTTLTLALAGIAGISLGVAGIGIMNVMLVSVAERTAEIGLLKALGAHRYQILTVFLTEAVLLSTLGGLLGIAVGWLAVEALVTVYPAIPASPPAWTIWTVLILSVGVGALFGVLPARQATRLDPIVALQG